jgi:hypothetical protein
LVRGRGRKRETGERGRENRRERGRERGRAERERKGALGAIGARGGGRAQG